MRLKWQFESVRFKIKVQGVQWEACVYSGLKKEGIYRVV